MMLVNNLNIHIDQSFAVTTKVCLVTVCNFIVSRLTANLNNYCGVCAMVDIT